MADQIKPQDIDEMLKLARQLFTKINSVVTTADPDDPPLVPLVGAKDQANDLYLQLEECKRLSQPNESK